MSVDTIIVRTKVKEISEGINEITMYDLPAGDAFATTFVIHWFMAVYCLCKGDSCSCFAHSCDSGKQICMGYLMTSHDLFKEFYGPSLADYLRKGFKLSYVVCHKTMLLDVSVYTIYLC